MHRNMTLLPQPGFNPRTLDTEFRALTISYLGHHASTVNLISVDKKGKLTEKCFKNTHYQILPLHIR